MLRLADNPPTMFSASSAEGLTDDDWDDTWRVVYVKPRQEKKLAHDLVQRGITYFLPMVERETSSGGRRRRNLYPLFASYLFFAGDGQARLSCLRTERTTQLIEPEREDQQQFRSELRCLAQALESSPEEIELYRSLVPGAHVRIKSGPLRGVEGAVVECDNNTLKLQLTISLLGVGAAVEIHPDLVEPY